VREQPLRGKRVVVTRSTDQASSLSNLLIERGAIPVELATIKTEPVDDPSRLDEALRRLNDYEWVVFTSANGVRYVSERLAANGVPVARLEALRVAAIGPTTARSLARCGLRVDVVPDEAVGESLVDAMSSNGLQGTRILLPVARDARDVVANGLSSRGAFVDRIVVYETRAVGDPTVARQAVANSDVVTLTSGSTAHSLASLIGDDVGLVLRSTVVASIGPLTTKAARDHEIRVDVEAFEHTIVGLVSAIEKWLVSADEVGGRSAS
jgi:uroporphyrinogen-III synthase